MFILGGFAKGPFNSIQNKRWNIILFGIFVYKFGYFYTGIMYGISGLLFLLIAQLSHIQNECIQLNIEKKNYLKF